MFGRWTGTCAVYKIEQQKTRALPQFDILWCFILCVYNTAAERTWDVGILEERRKKLSNIFLVCCVLFFSTQTFFLLEIYVEHKKIERNCEHTRELKAREIHFLSEFIHGTLSLSFPCTIQLVFLHFLLYVIKFSSAFLAPAIQP